MNTVYSHDKKKKLADKISKIQKKEDLVKIFEIIYADNKNITENKNGIFMFFHKLKDQTYHKLEEFMKNKKAAKQEIINQESELSSENGSDKKEYIPYTQDEFPCQTGINPKLKFSNREKNLLKRKRYDKTIIQEMSNSNNSNNSSTTNSSSTSSQDKN